MVAKKKKAEKPEKTVEKVEKKEEVKEIEKPSKPVSEVISAKNLVKGSFTVAGGTIKIVAFSAAGGRFERDIKIDGRNDVDLILK